MKEAFVYKTTNLVNGKIYIGVRTLQGNRADETYLGSGKHLKSAIEIYGKHCFEREVLFSGTQDQCYELEELIVDKGFIQDNSTYNHCIGGLGGNRNCSDAISKAQKLIHGSMSESEKNERKDWLNSIRRPDLAVKGKEHPKHVGLWHTPKGVFDTSREAATANGMDYSHLRKICRNPDRVMRYPERYNALKGSTWRDCGFWLESISQEGS